MFKVGDKVTIKTRKELKATDGLDRNSEYIWLISDPDQALVTEMEEFYGKVCTISNVWIDSKGAVCYNLKEDDEGYIWNDWMFKMDGLREVIKKLKKEINESI